MRAITMLTNSSLGLITGDSVSTLTLVTRTLNNSEHTDRPEQKLDPWGGCRHDYR